MDTPAPKVMKSFASANKQGGSLVSTLLGVLLLAGIIGGGAYWLYLGPAKTSSIAVEEEPVALTSTTVQTEEIPADPQTGIETVMPADIHRPEDAPAEVAQPEAETVEQTPVEVAEEKKQPDFASLGASAQLRKIDELMRGSNLAEALSALEIFVNGGHSAEETSQGYYRMGIVFRTLKREDEAVSAWQKSFRSYPQTVGGRLSALVLGDTKFSQVCGANPKYDEWESVRDFYSAALGVDGARFLSPQVASRVVGNLHTLNERIIFSRFPCTGAVYHEVEGGDYLSTIARKYGVHFDSIARINQVNPDRIRLGQKLKIIKGECSIVVDKKDLTLTWYLDGKWVRQYPCCVGPEDKTPAGSYTITRKEVDPAWPDPVSGRVYKHGHPSNILGSRWMTLEGGRTEGLGIHGTTLPQSIPGRTSAGCVRLKNEDVEELYGFALIGTTVIVRE
jgi:hypothetical protein